jgi:outer membrane immunogenic protein
MKRLLAILVFIAASSSAFASDFPPPPNQMVPVRYAPLGAYNWSGCYFGGEGGAGWGKSSQTVAFSPRPADVGLPISNGFGVSGTLLGVTLGCNYQLANFVFGVEGDPSWANVTATVRDLPPFSPNRLSSTTEESLSTLRARAGVAWDRFLFYGTGGAAFAGVNVNVCASLANACVANSQLMTGWVAGGGIEWAAYDFPNGSFTFKLEYLHADLGTGLFLNPPAIFGPGLIAASRNVTLSNDIIRAGLNWKFAWCFF